MAVRQLIAKQQIEASIDKVWDFISRPENLKKITPPSMGFEITSPGLPEKMHAGMIIGYRVRPLAGIPQLWLTEITQVQDLHYFIDEQRVGPYKLWHHQHELIPNEKGVLMVDTITYQIPLGGLGEALMGGVVKSKLKGIFKFRESAMMNFFTAHSAQMQWHKL